MNTLKNRIQEDWAVWACEDNTVHYLLNKNGKVKWVEATQHYKTDDRNLVLFESEKEVRLFVETTIRGNSYPKAVNTFEISRVFPKLIDKKYTFDYGKYNKAHKIGIKVKE